MSGNMHRWKSNDLLEGGDGSQYQNLPYDTASQFSTYSNISNDDRMRSPDVGQRLRTLFKEGLFTDVKFVISCGGAKPKPSLLAHKAILAVGSTKFREILFESSGQTSEIQINHIPFEAFRNVIEYLYTDDVMFENDESVLETLSAALKFEVQPLVDKCESYIESVELTEENVCSKFQLATDKKLASLKARCVEFIQENTGSVMRSQNFIAANSSTVRSICKMEKLNLRSEIELLQGVIQWSAARQDGKNSQRTLIEPFLKHIRLLNVSGEEFNHFVQRYHNIFTTPEAANILISLANPSNPAPNLPSWCKRGNIRCTFQQHITPRTREKFTGVVKLNSSTDTRPRGRFNPLQKLFIQLKPIYSKTYLPQMTSILQMNCLRDNYQIEGLKLTFGDPVHEMSVIENLQIDVQVLKNVRKFRLQENVRIENTKEVDYMFEKRVYCNKGETAYFRVEAKDVKNYKFLRFDEDQGSTPDDFPFDWSLCCEPKEYKMYFISEVYFRTAPPPSISPAVRRIGPPIRNPTLNTYARR